MRWVSAIAAALILCASASAFAQSPDLTGWWRADLSHAGETETFYLHFDQHEGQPRARFSVPVARMYEAPAGNYEATSTHVRVPGLGWRLDIEEGGAALRGVMPPSLVAVYQIPARFVRSSPPTPPAELAPRFDAPTPRWSVSVGAEVWAGVVIDATRRQIYVGADDGRVHALSAHSGATQWAADLGAPIRATPTLAGGRLYVATDAALVALDPRNGARIWTATFGAQRATRLPISDPNSAWDHYSSSAVVDGPFIAVAARDGCIHALHTATGAERWRTCTESGVVTSTPALTRDSVFFGGFDGAAYSLQRANGAVRWRRDLGGPIPRDAVAADANIVFGARSYELHALHPYTGETDWARYFWFSWIDSPPAVVDDVLYVGASDALAVQAFIAQTGRRLWAAPVPGWSWARPAVGRGAVYAAVAGGAYLAPRRGGLAAIERRDGALRWFYETAAPADPTRPYGFAAAPAVGARMVFAADLDGMVYAFPE